MMRRPYFLVVGWLAVCHLACSPGGGGTPVGRWESVDTPGLLCEFTEDGAVRLRGEFGQASGTYTADGGARGWIYLDSRERADVPTSLRASVVRGKLVLETEDERRAQFRRP